MTFHSLVSELHSFQSEILAFLVILSIFLRLLLRHNLNRTTMILFFTDTGVTANMVQPGNVDTRYGRMVKARYPHLPSMYTPQEGARTVLYCALEKELEQVTGTYFT